MTSLEDILSTLDSAYSKSQIFFIGKRLAVLGPRNVGKTRILNFLTKGELPKVGKEKATVFEPTQSNIYEYNKTRFVLKKTHDVGGGSELYGFNKEVSSQWKSIISKCDVVIFIFRCDWVSNPSLYEAQCATMLDEITKIANYFDHFYRRSKPVILVGTFLDATNLPISPQSATILLDNSTELRLMYNKLEEVCGKKLFVVAGSLKDLSSASLLNTWIKQTCSKL
ncbi:MAG: GTPase domain-containing protein [Methylococcales bacterium]|nr:GTPase domain-containing protein [Methylococcales bacterium]MDD5632006.1 GTPase domain-containing protein [Methylococcales bacterium]